MSGSVAETGATGVEAVVGTGWGGCGGDVEGGLGVGIDGGGLGYRWSGDGNRLSRWDYNLGTEPNAHISYAPVLEHHHQIMSTLGLLDILT